MTTGSRDDAVAAAASRSGSRRVSANRRRTERAQTSANSGQMIGAVRASRTLDTYVARDEVFSPEPRLASGQTRCRDCCLKRAVATAAAAAPASCGVGAGTAMSMAAGGACGGGRRDGAHRERRRRLDARRRGWGRRKAAEFVPLVGPALGLGPATPRGRRGLRHGLIGSSLNSRGTPKHALRCTSGAARAAMSWDCSRWPAERVFVNFFSGVKLNCALISPRREEL